MNSPLGLRLKQAGYSTGALAQAMRDGEPNNGTKFLRNRTKMFHVKHFGTIDGLRKHTFVVRGQVRNGHLPQGKNAIGFKF
jgi:hypothetical protein